MDQQLSFPGLEDSSDEISSLYAALLPSPSATGIISESTARFEQQHGSLGKLVRPDQLHVTLVFIKEYRGDIPKGDIRKASEAFIAATRVASFPISLDQVQSWGTTLVMSVIKSSPLMEFQPSLLRQLILHGLPCRGNPKFNPHLTLSRNSRKVAPQTIEPITWEATEVVLIQSVIREGRHIHLGRWPLSAAS